MTTDSPGAEDQRAHITGRTIAAPCTAVYRAFSDPERLVVIEHVSDHHFILTITFDEREGATRVGWRQVFDSIEHFLQIKTLVTQANEQNLDRLVAALRGAR